MSRDLHPALDRAEGGKDIGEKDSGEQRPCGRLQSKVVPEVSCCVSKILFSDWLTVKLKANTIEKS